MVAHTGAESEVSRRIIRNGSKVVTFGVEFDHFYLTFEHFLAWFSEKSHCFSNEPAQS